MSATGSGTFDNNDAVEWLDAFEGDGVSAIETALQTIDGFDAGDYIEMQDAAHAVAAAHVVAAIRDGDMEGLPEAAVAAIGEHRAKIEEMDARALARKAVLRVLKSSELKDHYDDAGDEEWEAGVQAIADRLRK